MVFAREMELLFQDTPCRMIWRYFPCEVEGKATTIKLETKFKVSPGQDFAKAPRPPDLFGKRIVAKSLGWIVLK